MQILYKVTDLNGGYHGSFSEFKDAVEHAEEMANELDFDMFIEETKTEIVKYISPV